ncbi:hypothetical protein GJ496_004428 [Pomphorhynchus laevis]|nr:hypothetical protein GJ496_004428 [Pomphorhynchus laevis]
MELPDKLNEKRTDYFPNGNISFVLREVKYNSGQKYVKVPSNANPAELIIFMRDVWKLECPMIVLSVLTGRSTDKEWQSRKTMSAFKSAIKNAAVNTNMWVLTHGMNFGITRIIGEAYNEEFNSRAVSTSTTAGQKWTKGDPSLPLVLVGICETHLIANADLFNGDNIKYTIKGGMLRNNKAELNPYHTHYILVDDYDKDVVPNLPSTGSLNLRAKIERKIVRSEPLRTGRFTKTLISEPRTLASRHPMFYYNLGTDSSHTITLHKPNNLMSTTQSRSDERSAMTVTTAGGSDIKHIISGTATNVETPISTTPGQPSNQQTTSQIDEDKDMLRDVVPIVCMVIGGGLTTLRDIAERVHLDIPILVCKGSGLAADILASVHEELSDNSDPDFDSKMIRNEISRRMCDAFPTTEQPILDECLNAVMQVINGCSMRQRIFHSRLEDPSALGAQYSANTVLSVFDTRNWKTDPTKLHKELLLTLLNCQRVQRKKQFTMSRDQVYRQMQLLLDWNAPDLMQLEIFEQEDIPVYAIPVHIFEQAFVRPKREAFVELFLDRNFQIQRFFSCGRIRRWMLLNQWSFFHEVCVNQLLKGYDCLENYDIDDDISPLINLIFQRLTGLFNIFRPIELKTNLNTTHMIRLVSPETQTFTSLTLLAALLNRHDLARVLLKRTDCPIPTSLFCSLLYAKLAHYCREPFLKQQLKDQSSEMADYAVGILDLCFQSSDHCSAIEILDQPHPDFSNLTTIQIAYKSKVLQFLAHPLCQRWISQKYYGGLRFLDLSFGFFRLTLMIKVLCSAILVIPSIWWVTLESTEDFCYNTNCQQKEETHQPNTENDISGLENQQHCVCKMDNCICKASIQVTSPSDGMANAYKDTFNYRKFDEFPFDYSNRWLIMRKLWSAPITKFYFNFVAYIIFLLTLGLATLWPSCGNLFLDTMIGIWVCLMTVELSRCTYINFTASDGYMAITHSVIDICLHVTFLISFLWTRLIGNWSESASVLDSKFVMCLGVLYFTYRVPFVYMAISETLGPQLVWLEYTIKHDFADFVKLLLLAIFAGGVTINAMIYPFWPIDHNAFSRIVARSFLAMFLTEKADLENNPASTCVPPDPDSKICVEQSSGASSIANIGKFTPNTLVYTMRNLTPSCPTPTFRGWIFTLQHFILMKLFLMTMLYAMFNNSSLSIAKYSSLVWMFKRYENVMAFKTTSTLPPPLTIFYYLASLYKYLRKNWPTYNSVKKWLSDYVRYRWNKATSLLNRFRIKFNKHKEKKKRALNKNLDDISLQFVIENDSCTDRNTDANKEVDGDDKSKHEPPLIEDENFDSTSSNTTRHVSGKDGNYWRLLAQDYIGKREEGLLTMKTTTGADSDSLIGIRKKLLGESSHSFTQNHQIEMVKLNMNHVKDHVNLIEKSVDKLSEKMQTVQEDIGRMSEQVASNKQNILFDIQSMYNRLCPLLIDKETDELTVYTDSAEAVRSGLTKWNALDTIELRYGITKTLDRRSWQINSESGLPTQYKIDAETKLPICPWLSSSNRNVELKQQILIESVPPHGLNLFGPNHEIRLLLIRKSLFKIECVFLKNLDNNLYLIPKRIVQCPLHDKQYAVANNILRSIFPEAAQLVTITLSPLWRGYVSDDIQNSQTAWVEAEYWISDMSNTNPDLLTTMNTLAEWISLEDSALLSLVRAYLEI